MLSPAPAWGVPVRVSFFELVVSRACTIQEAWLLCRGALVSPFEQNNVMQKVWHWRGTRSERSVVKQFFFLSQHKEHRERKELREMRSGFQAWLAGHLPSFFVLGNVTVGNGRAR